MQAVVVEEKNKADWDRFVECSPKVISWHIYDWFKVPAAYYGLDYYPLAVYDGGEVRGILPLYRVRTLRTGPALISVPYVVAGGIVAETREIEQALLQRAVEMSEEMGSIPITLKQYKEKVDGDFTTDESYYNRELTLTPDIDDLWNRISEHNREQIQLTEGENYTFEYPSQDFDGFYRALLQHHRIAGVPAPTRKWVRHLRDTGLYVVALLKRGNTVLAASMAKEFKDTVSFPFTSLPSPNPADEKYAYRLTWELLKDLAGRGIRIAHSGRIPDSEDVPQYRLGWGGEKNRYYYQYYGYSGKTESSSKRGSRRDLFKTVWRRTPIALSQLVGGVINKQFP